MKVPSNATTYCGRLYIVPYAFDEEQFRMRLTKLVIRPSMMADEGDVGTISVVVLVENRATSRWTGLVVMNDFFADVQPLLPFAFLEKAMQFTAGNLFSGRMCHGQ